MTSSGVVRDGTAADRDSPRLSVATTAESPIPALNTEIAARGGGWVAAANAQSWCGRCGPRIFPPGSCTARRDRASACSTSRPSGASMTLRRGCSISPTKTSGATDICCATSDFSDLRMPAAPVSGYPDRRGHERHPSRGSPTARSGRNPSQRTQRSEGRPLRMPHPLSVMAKSVTSFGDSARPRSRKSRVVGMRTSIHRAVS